MRIIRRELGLVDYRQCVDAMKSFTESRDEHSVDEFWLLQHPAVFTLGKAAKPEHLLAPGEIPVVQADRGGQVTYHGPGQLVIYTLIDLKRAALGPRELVRRLEAGILNCLDHYAIDARRRDGAPGVYVDGKKIAALGLRIRRTFSYHGVALNVAMDLEPYLRINPCGYPDLAVTEVRAHGGPSDCAEVAEVLLDCLLEALFPRQVPRITLHQGFDGLTFDQSAEVVT